MSKRKGILLPGHNYVGPGNELDGVKPVDEDDSIARLHDEDYARGASVPISDDIAIYEFYDSARKGNIHSLIGAAGLSLKRILELGFGEIYNGGKNAHIDENNIRDALKHVGRSYPTREQLDILADPNHPDYQQEKVNFNALLDTGKRPEYKATGNEVAQISPPETEQDYNYKSREQKNQLQYERGKVNLKNRLTEQLKAYKRINPNLGNGSY